MLLSLIGLFTTASACAFALRVWPPLRRCCSRLVHREAASGAVPKPHDVAIPPHDSVMRSLLSTEQTMSCTGSPFVTVGGPRSNFSAGSAAQRGSMGSPGSAAQRGSNLGSPLEAVGPVPFPTVIPVMSTKFWLLNMVPIGVAQGLTFACGNAAYMYLTITFTQMLSAFTPSVTLLLLYLSGVEIPTTRATFAVLLICVGCLLSSYGEGQFHVVGVAFRSMGILTEAIRLVLTQRLLKHHKLNIVESQYYLAPIGGCCLLLGSTFTELPRAWEEGAWQTVKEHPLFFFASATLGLAASFMTFLVIKMTNSVTLKVLNAARNAAFVLFTVGFLHEEASQLQIIGYSLSILAFTVYTYVRITGR